MTTCIKTTVTGGCTAGQFAWPNPSPCLTCPEGFECQQWNAPPRKCLPGWYSSTGAQYCTKCPAGSKCPSEYFSTKSVCSAGFYSLPGSLNCYPIPARMSGTLSTRPVWCNFLLGEISPTASATCTACALGSGCPSDNLAQ